ncbi:MAG: IMP dehydrogenase [Candidatus Sungiibacteriota bacterium]|uniref:IMP dehydrogenase n=1 Tax=Candidatus Sungiibacteriota bacterium TaxID=2750080 RepID=A0A7T5RK30_9BACT|nr:MAG: IMP dehydrogenase [Candidatus Sungbacteria bacterium]
MDGDEILKINGEIFQVAEGGQRPTSAITKEYLAQKGLPADIALTFEDVTILDFKSDVPSRSAITDTKSRLARDIFLQTPIVSANMDTITESQMAIALARLGGLGFIHQFLPIERRVEEIKKVKRADSGVIENPFNISPEATVAEAKNSMENFQISGLLVIDPVSAKLVGIITSRDVRFETMLEKRVAEVMTNSPLITAPPGTTLEQARVILKKNKIEKLPLVDNEERVVGLITAKDLLKIEQYPKALRDPKGRLRVGATIGVSGKFIEEADQLLRAGADIILIDTARGFSTKLEEAIKNLKNSLGEKVIIAAGNVDTPEGALLLIEAGADAVKIGIGGGAVCKTREGPGVGVPQISAIAECTAVALKHRVPIIADGGIRGGADFCKALAAGASTVMMGWMFAGCEETPGEPFYEDGEQWKIYRGSASLEFQLSRSDRDEGERVRTPEGVPRRVRYKGEAADVIHELMSYLRSSMSYVGTWTLEEYRKKTRFRRQTISGYEEGKPARP